MHIGFDLDKIFINSPPFIPGRILERMYRKADHNQLHFRIPSRPEQFLRRCIHLPFLRQPIIENLYFLRSFPKKQHKLYLISSRFGFLKKITMELVKRHKLDEIFDEMYFNFKDDQPHIFKNAMVQKLNLHLYVDDDLALLQYLAKRNKKIKFFWLTKRGNRRSTTEKNIFAIKDLSAILLNNYG